MIFDWTECGQVPSERNALEGETFHAFVINALNDEILERHPFTVAKARLDQYLWVADFCKFINSRSNLIQAGLWNSEKGGSWEVANSSFQNRLWSTTNDIRAFTTAPCKDNWVQSTALHSSAALKTTDTVVVTVRAEASGLCYQRIVFKPDPKRLSATQWLHDLAVRINKDCPFIKAGCPGTSGQSQHQITPSEKKDANHLWLPKGARLVVGWNISEFVKVADLESGRDALEGETISVFVIDDVSDRQLERITLRADASNKEMRTWPAVLCNMVNTKSDHVRAGAYDKATGNCPVIAGTSYQNKLWSGYKGLRVFTTRPHLDNWEAIEPLLTDEVMTLDERVVVTVRSAPTGRLCETLVFAPTKDRLTSALWTRDLSTLINEKSLYLRAGQANAEKHLIETIADVYKSSIWAPKHSNLTVTWERCQLQPSVPVRSQRNAVENEIVRLFVLDEATGMELERREYKTPKAHIGSKSGWVVDFCNMVNANSKLVRMGEAFKEGQLVVAASGYKNLIWPLAKDLRAFTTSTGLSNWAEARCFAFEGDLKAGDRIVVHVRSELTGLLYKTHTFVPTLKDKKARVGDWTKALCEKLNKENFYIRAGWKNEEKQIIEPVADHEKNVIWVPMSSGLTVEVLNIADKTRHAAPIDVQAGVNPQTGKAHIKIPFGTLVGNDGAGPSLDMGLCWTKDTGWDLYGFSFMLLGASAPGNEKALIVSPDGNVEMFSSLGLSRYDVLTFQSFKLKKREGGYDTWNILHKNGTTERLDTTQQSTGKWHGIKGYLPTLIKNVSGHQLTLNWSELTDEDLTKPLFMMLKSVIYKERKKDGKEIKLFESSVNDCLVTFTMYPDDPELKTVFEVVVESRCEDSIAWDDSNDFWSIMRKFSGTFPFGNILSVSRKDNAGVSRAEIEYDRFDGAIMRRHPISAIVRIWSRTYTHRFSYAMQFPEPGELGESWVSCYNHRQAGAMDTVRLYKYEARKTVVTSQCGEYKTVTTLHYSGARVLTKMEEVQGEVTTTTEYERSEDRAQETQTLTTRVTKGKHVKASTVVVDADGNIIKSMENGIIKEWTYYDAFSTDKRKEYRRVQHMSSVAHGVGIVIDYLNPIGWCLNIFADQGLTWGTEEVEVEWRVRCQKKHEAEVFNLPIALQCPGDEYFFKTYVESEKIYAERDGVRTDLSWTFYSYAVLPERNGCYNLVKPVAKLTVLYPETDDYKKLSKWTSRSMTLEKTSYITDLDSANFGRVLTQTSVRLDKLGEVLKNTQHDVTYEYAVKDGILTTSISETFGDKVESKTSIASEFLSGRKSSATDWLQSRTTWAYDAHGRLVAQTANASASKAADRLKTTHQYHEFLGGHFVTTLSPEGEHLRAEYNQSGVEIRRWTCGTGFLGWRLLSSVKLDDVDRPVLRTELDYLPNGVLFSKQEWRLHYDDWGTVKETEMPDGSRQCLESDLSKPNELKTTAYTKVDGKARHKVVKTFDQNGNETRLEVQDGAGAVQAWTERSFDAGNRLINSKDNHGVEVSLTYDKRGRLRTSTQGGIVTSTDYKTYSDLVSSISIAEVDKEDSVVELGRLMPDSLSRLTSTVVGGREVSYEYDGVSPLGRRTTPFPELDDAFTGHKVVHTVKNDPRSGIVEELHEVEKAKYSTTNVYSLRGRPLSFTNAFGQKTVYHYDRAGRQYRTVSAGAHNTLVFDGFGFLSRETVWHVAAGSTASTSYTYNALGQETARRFVIDDKHKMNLEYSYEKGRIKTVKALQDKTLIRKEEYAYDQRGRVTTWTCEGQERATDYWLQEQLKKQMFTYDLVGNIQTCTSETTGSKKSNTATYCYDNTDRAQLKKITHSHRDCRAVDLEYDIEGRLIKNPVNNQALHYDANDRQVGSGKNHLAYYDSYGRRVRNEGDYYGEWFYYDEDLPYAREGYVLIGDKKTCDKRRTLLLNQSGSCQAQQQTLSSGGDKEINSFELKDMQGSVVASWRIGKEGFNWLTYTPFGYRPSSADDLHWLGFTGQPLDHQSGSVYHMGNGCRTYNPVLQVFHAADGTEYSPFGGGGLNWYGYCSGDPRNLSDPTGHAEMISQTTRMYASPFLDDPIVNVIFTGAVFAAAAVLTGGTTLAIAAGVGMAVISTGFSVTAVLVRDHDAALAEVFDWLSVTADLVPLGGGKVASKMMSRGGRASRLAGKVPAMTKAANGPIIARHGNMMNLRPLRDGSGFMFEDFYKGGRRLNIDAHGVMHGNMAYPVIGNKAVTPQELIDLLKRRQVNLDNYVSVRLIVCDSATGGANSFAQQLSTLSGRPVKGFEGDVLAQINARGALTEFAEKRKIKLTTAVHMDFAEPCVVIKKRPALWEDRKGFLHFNYKPVKFTPLS